MSKLPGPARGALARLRQDHAALTVPETPGRDNTRIPKARRDIDSMRARPTPTAEFSAPTGARLTARQQTTLIGNAPCMLSSPRVTGSLPATATVPLRLATSPREYMMPRKLGDWAQPTPCVLSSAATTGRACTESTSNHRPVGVAPHQESMYSRRRARGCQRSQRFCRLCIAGPAPRNSSRRIHCVDGRSLSVWSDGIRGVG